MSQDDIFSQLVWLEPDQNPFGLRVLDCRPFSTAMISTTKDPNIAARFTHLRSVSGEGHRGRHPEDALSVRCELNYPFNGESRDGSLFVAQQMEDKWDIYLYDGHLYFARSWTGELALRATIAFKEKEAVITEIEANRGKVLDDPKLWFLLPYDFDWWLPHVREVCDQFVRASQGDIDAKHWRDIYKQERAYGADNVNGWLVKLVPYLKNGRTGNFTAHNPLLGDPDEQVSTKMLPSGISQVPFRCRWQGQAEDVAMEFLGGFLGVTQDTATLALRPKLGWAARQGSELDRLFAKLSKHKPAPPLDAPEFDACIASFHSEWRCELPGDYLSFYKHCNGVSLFKNAFCFRPLEAVEPDFQDEVVILNAGPWVRFCDLADGSFVAIELHHTYKKGWKVVRGQSGVTPANSPIIAWSFAEFLEKALSSGGRLDVLEEIS